MHPDEPIQPTSHDDVVSEKTRLSDPHIAPHAEAVQQLAAVDDTLSNRVESLRKTLSELAPEVTKIRGEQNTVWSWLKGGGILIGFDILVTILGVILGFNVYSVQHQNDALIAQLQQQQGRLNVSIHEACNLYGTFESFYSDAAKARFVGGPVQYDILYKQLQASGDRLECNLKHVVPGT